jgi:hypothetical protein
MVAKKAAQKTFCKTERRKEGRCWTEFYKNVKRCKGYRESIAAIKDHNGRFIRDPIEKANIYYASLFSRERNNPQIKSTQSGKPITNSISIIRKRLSAIGKKKSVGPDGILGEILKLGGDP